MFGQSKVLSVINSCFDGYLDWLCSLPNKGKINYNSMNFVRHFEDTNEEPGATRTY